MNLIKPKRLIIWNGGSNKVCDICCGLRIAAIEVMCISCKVVVNPLNDCRSVNIIIPNLLFV
jgi:hypothetical protein